MKVHVTIHGIAEVPDCVKLSDLVAVSTRNSRGREVAIKDERSGSVFRVIPSVTYIKEWDEEFPPEENPNVEET